MHVVVSGASGLTGSTLVPHLRERGHRVTRLVRSDDASDDASRWDPRLGRVDQGVVDRADVVVNPSGSPVVRWPPNSRYRRNLLSSRIDSTTTLARAIAESSDPPAFISTSGMSYYGSDRGDEMLTEQSPAGDGGFMPGVVHRWEKATGPASEAGSRVCLIRTTAALDSGGGLLRLALPIFKAGLGARLGSGRQHMSMLSLRDWVSAATFLIEHQDASGPFNFGMPNPTTNAAFTDALGDALHRPTVLVAPKLVIKAVGGSLGNDIIGSLRVLPRALTDLGFTFQDPDVDAVVQAALS